jgi:hypothetical protein
MNVLANKSQRIEFERHELDSSALGKGTVMNSDEQ